MSNRACRFSTQTQQSHWLRNAILFAFILLNVPGFDSSGLAGAEIDIKAVEEGRKLFQGSCSVCHGIDGRGSPRGPDVTQGLTVLRGKDEEVATLIKRGVPGSSMPAFSLPDNEIQQLVAFIRSLSVKAVDLPAAGDVTAGQQIFQRSGRCSQCHMIRGQGGLLGPDLSNVRSDMTAQEIQDRVLEPGRIVTRNYRPVTVKTVDGRTISGTLRNRDNYSLQMMDAEGRLHFLSSSEIRHLEFAEKFPGHDDLKTRLTSSELRDLLAFLSRQTVVR